MSSHYIQGQLSTHIVPTARQHYTYPLQEQSHNVPACAMTEEEWTEESETTSITPR